MASALLIAALAVLIVAIIWRRPARQDKLPPARPLQPPATSPAVPPLARPRLAGQAPQAVWRASPVVPGAGPGKRARSRRLPPDDPALLLWPDLPPEHHALPVVPLTSDGASDETHSTEDQADAEGFAGEGGDGGGAGASGSWDSDDAANQDSPD